MSGLGSQNFGSERLSFRVEETGTEWRRGMAKVTRVADGSNRTRGRIQCPVQSPHTTAPSSCSPPSHGFEVALKFRTHPRLTLYSNIQRTHQRHQGISFNCLFTQTDCLFIFGAKLGDTFTGHSLSHSLISNRELMCNVIAEYEFYFFLPSRKFKICGVIFKGGEKKKGIIPASQRSCPKAHAALVKALARLGGTQVTWSFTRGISGWGGGGWVSTHSSGRRGRGLAASLITVTLDFSGVDIRCWSTLGIFGYSPSLHRAMVLSPGLRVGPVDLSLLGYLWYSLGLVSYESQMWLSCSWVDEEFEESKSPYL